jgi:hypothetical protein
MRLGGVMSKKAKSESKKRRRSKKAAMKSAQKALYESRKREGQNTKSKRVQLRAKRKKRVRLVRHRLGRCGNVGCKTCNPLP